MSYKKINSKICILSILFLLSCMDDESVLEPEKNYSSAIQLKIGNYWVYGSQTIILNSDIIQENFDDSTFISRDTIINDKVYAVMENLFGLYQLQRDSSGYIVDEKNRITFSAHNFQDTLYRHENEFGLMNGKEEWVEVPAGKFQCVSFITLFRDHHTDHHHDPHDPTVHEYDHRYKILNKTWYAKEIGIVKSVFYFGNTVAYERKLKRFKINQ